MVDAVKSDVHSAQLKAVEQLIFTEPVLARQKCLAVLAGARQAFDAPTLIAAALQLSLIEDQLGDLESAIAVLSEALVFAEKFKLQQRLPQLLEQIGRCYYSQARYPQALEFWHQCAVLCGNDADFISTRGLALMGLGQICDACGENGQAITLHQRAHTLLAGIDDCFLLTMAKINWAVNLQKTGQNDAAEFILQDALQLSLTHQLPHHAAESYFRLAEIAIVKQQWDQAERLLEEGLLTLATTPYHWCEVNLLALWATVAAQQQRLAQALESVKRGLLIAEQDGLRHLEMRLNQQASQYARAMGQDDQAEEFLRKSHFLEIHLNTAFAPNTLLNFSALSDLLI